MGFLSDPQEKSLVTWREKLKHQLSLYGESMEEVEFIYPEESVLDVPFDDGYGLAEGPDFLAFTAQRVYFPVCYDGMEWVGSVPRHPEFIQPGDGHHQGG